MSNPTEGERNVSEITPAALYAFECAALSLMNRLEDETAVPPFITDATADQEDALEVYAGIVYANGGAF